MGLSYFACVVLVVLALMVRLSVTLQRRSREQQQAAVLNEVMSGAKSTEETRGKSLLGTLTGRREEADDGREKRVRRDTSWADSTSGTWASPTIRRNDPERFTVPVVPEPGTLREPVRSGRDRRDEEFEPVVRRASRREEEELERVVRRETEVLEPVARRATPSRSAGVPPAATRSWRPAGGVRRGSKRTWSRWYAGRGATRNRPAAGRGARRSASRWAAACPVATRI